MFAYAMPVRRAVANAAGVSVLSVVVVPLYEPEVAAGTPVKGTTTPALLPGGAGAWMWAAVAGDVRPAKVSDQVDVEVDGSNVNVMLPVAVLVVGGTSLSPASVPVQEISPVAAWTGRTPMAKVQSRDAKPTTPKVPIDLFDVENILCLDKYCSIFVI